MVMLSRLVEKDKLKAHQYWPEGEAGLAGQERDLGEDGLAGQERDLGEAGLAGQVRDLGEAGLAGQERDLAAGQVRDLGEAGLAERDLGDGYRVKHHATNFTGTFFMRCSNLSVSLTRQVPICLFHV